MNDKPEGTVLATIDTVEPAADVVLATYMGPDPDDLGMSFELLPIFARGIIFNPEIKNELDHSFYQV